MDDDLKKEISDFFLTDSSNYLARYNALIDVFTDISTRSKILVDLLFSFECSLKSLIFLRSNSDEKSTYKNIRTHNLNNLLSKIDTAKFQDIASFILDENLDDISVGVRYTLEANIKFRENGSLGILMSVNTSRSGSQRNVEPVFFRSAGSFLSCPTISPRSKWSVYLNPSRRITASK